MRLFDRPPVKDWDAIDRENEAGMDLYRRAMDTDSIDELRDLWRQANSLVGMRAPADRAPFLAYGYISGKQDAIREASLRAAEAARPAPESVP